MSLFKIPKIPKIPIPSPAKAIIKINLELQKVALKAQKYAAYIAVPDIGTAMKPISKAFAIKNNPLQALSNLTNSQIQSLLNTAQSTIANQTQNIQNAASLNSIDENGDISEQTTEQLNQDLENLSNMVDEAIANLQSLENMGKEQLEQLKELADELKNFDIRKVNSRRLTIPIPKMPKLPFGIIQPF